MSTRPDNVGIVALELYTPNQVVKQEELEKFDGVSAGKYTIGLGQTKMAFCSDREDVASVAMTAVSSLMTKYGISYADIGHLQVGTESRPDKSKSVKTALMQLFQESGNHNVEGVDVTNACYGGTAAVFHAVNWVESRSWDGRYALVVAADIAVYAKGPARPTGGAGAVAILIGADAPIVVESEFAHHHMDHAYDFYKPRTTSEYPEVDGKLSVKCYLSALDNCYQGMLKKIAAKEGGALDLTSFPFMAFHSPYNKLVRKSFARLLYNDFLLNNDSPHGSVLAEYKALKPEDTYFNRDLEKAAIKGSQALYDAMVVPSIRAGKDIGNMYCASLWGALVSLISTKADELEGKRVVLFSYGSGLCSKMFPLKFRSSPADMAAKIDLFARLDARKEVAPEAYTAVMELREERYLALDWEATGSVDDLAPGTWYVVSFDAKGRKKYALKA